MRSLLIVTSLQGSKDKKALEVVKKFSGKITWQPLNDLLIDHEVWAYAIDTKHYEPKEIFCHPDILLYNPMTSVYYRGLSGLSIKGAKDYFGAVESIEKGDGRLKPEKALKMARTYNTFICSIIKNSTAWTLKNGYRTIIATLGITLDGSMRNKIGEIAEERIRSMILERLVQNDLVIEPSLPKDQPLSELPLAVKLRNDIVMKFSSEPDIYFIKDADLIAIVEIKGGNDPAGALERYGAAKKSFESAIQKSPRCVNYYLAAVYTKELNERIKIDRLVYKTYDIINLLDKPQAREDFFTELFHHTLRMI